MMNDSFHEARRTCEAARLGLGSAGLMSNPMALWTVLADLHKTMIYVLDSMEAGPPQLGLVPEPSPTLKQAALNLAGLQGEVAGALQRYRDYENLGRHCPDRPQAEWVQKLTYVVASLLSEVSALRGALQAGIPPTDDPQENFPGDPTTSSPSAPTERDTRATGFECPTHGLRTVENALLGCSKCQEAAAYLTHPPGPRIYYSSDPLDRATEPQEGSLDEHPFEIEEWVKVSGHA